LAHVQNALGYKNADHAIIDAYIKEKATIRTIDVEIGPDNILQEDIVAYRDIPRKIFTNIADLFTECIENPLNFNARGQFIATLRNEKKDNSARREVASFYNDFSPVAGIASEQDIVDFFGISHHAHNLGVTIPAELNARLLANRNYAGAHAKWQHMGEHYKQLRGGRRG
jgi:hypothetical protein